MNEFDGYIERYCREHKISREQALQHAIVKECGKYYENAQKGKIAVTEVSAGCGGAELKNQEVCE